VPIDSDPDTPDRARETAAAPDRRGGPDSHADREAQHGPEAQDGPESQRSREPRDGPGASEVPDFRKQQIAEHARYHRVVDAEYQAFEARRAWNEAVPGLRATWEEHKERYPEQSRQVPHTPHSHVARSLRGLGFGRRVGTRPAGWPVAGQDLPAVWAGGGPGAVGVVGQPPSPAVNTDIMVILALCRGAGYAVPGLCAGCCSCLRVCVVALKSA
jgi:hypothetical protein